jgi:hypothetical protein
MIIHLILAIIALGVLHPENAIAGDVLRLREVPNEARVLQSKILPHVQPSVQRWINETAKSLSQEKGEYIGLQPGIQSRFKGQSLTAEMKTSIEILVLMQAIKYMDDDIQATTVKLRGIEKQKKDLEARIRHEKDKGAIEPAKSLLDDLKGRLDGMNEMSEMTSLRLQMTMDRRSKFISTLSQMMKKVSTTQDTLVQNIK